MGAIINQGLLSNYPHVVLGLILLKYISDEFLTEVRTMPQRIIEQGQKLLLTIKKTLYA